MKAQQYHLIFKIIEDDDSVYPYIHCERNGLGFSLNSELATFIASGGIMITQEIINEVNGLNFGNALSNGFLVDIPGYSDQVTAKIFASPNRASFWDGTGYINVPIQDFLEILQEWINFLKSIKSKHYLSNR